MYFISHKWMLLVCLFGVAVAMPLFSEAQNTIYVDFTSDTAGGGCEPQVVHFFSHLKYQDSLHKPAIDTYDWDFGDGTPHGVGANPVHTYAVVNFNLSQQFDVKLTVTTKIGDDYTCLKKHFISLKARPQPVIVAKPRIATIADPAVQFDVDTVLSRNVLFHDTATRIYWTFGDYNNPDKGGYSDHKSSTYSYKDTGDYVVHLRVISNGCESYDSINVYIRPQMLVFIPNAFKPTGKHASRAGVNYYPPTINETFQPSVTDYTFFSMSVYNRAGQLLYFTSDPVKGWHGEFNGYPLPSATYVYIIVVKNTLGQEYTYKGTVELLR